MDDAAGDLPYISFYGLTARSVQSFEPPSYSRHYYERRKAAAASAPSTVSRDEESGMSHLDVPRPSCNADDEEEDYRGDSNRVEIGDDDYRDGASVVVDENDDDNDDDDDDDSLRVDPLSQSVVKAKRVQFQTPDSVDARKQRQQQQQQQQQRGDDLDGTTVSSFGSSTPFMSYSSLPSSQQQLQQSQSQSQQQQQQQPSHSQMTESQKVQFIEEERQKQQMLDPDNLFYSPLSQQAQQQQQQRERQQISIVRVIMVDFEHAITRRCFFVHRWSPSSSSATPTCSSNGAELSAGTSVNTQQQNPLRCVSDLADAIKSQWRTADLVAGAIDGTRVTAALRPDAELSPRFVSVPAGGVYNKRQAASSSIYLHNAVPGGGGGRDQLLVLKELARVRQKVNTSSSSGYSVFENDLFYFVCPVAATSVKYVDEEGQDSFGELGFGDDDDDDDDEEEEEEDDEVQQEMLRAAKRREEGQQQQSAFLLLGCPPVIAPSPVVACSLVSSQGSIVIPQVVQRSAAAAPTGLSSSSSARRGVSSMTMASSLNFTPRPAAAAVSAGSATGGMRTTMYSTSRTAATAAGGGGGGGGGGGATASSYRSNVSMFTAEGFDASNCQNDDSSEGDPNMLTHTGRLFSRSVHMWMVPAAVSSPEQQQQQQQKQNDSSSSAKSNKKTSGAALSSSQEQPQRFLLVDEPPAISEAADKTRDSFLKDGDGFSSPLPPLPAAPNNGAINRQQQQKRAIVLKSLSAGVLVRWWTRRYGSKGTAGADTAICRIISIHVVVRSKDASAATGIDSNGSSSRGGGGGFPKLQNILSTAIAPGFSCPRFVLQEVVSGRLIRAKIWPIDLERIE